MRNIREIHLPEGEPRLTYVADVMLISPEHAERLGIVGAEAPVFVGTNDDKINHCKGCQESYPPEVYQAGRVVRDSHFGCKPRHGGIYFKEWSTLKEERAYNGDWEVDTDYWYASVEPLGEIKRDDWQDSRGKQGVTIRSEGVFVKEIFCFCVRRGMFVLQGVLYGDSQVPGSMLFEFCGFEGHSDFNSSFRKKDPRYQFVVRDGEVLFSQPR